MRHTLKLRPYYGRSFKYFSKYKDATGLRKVKGLKEESEILFLFLYLKDHSSFTYSFTLAKV